MFCIIIKSGTGEKIGKWKTVEHKDAEKRKKKKTNQNGSEGELCAQQKIKIS